MLGHYGVAAQLVASQAVLSYMEVIAGQTMLNGYYKSNSSIRFHSGAAQTLLQIFTAMAVEMNSFLSPPETFVFNINIFISAVQH
jgi:hypothetical protein